MATFRRSSAVLRHLGCFLLNAALTAPVAAQYGDVEARVLRVSDGDTYRVTVPGWPSIIGHDMPIRLKDYDTPEISGRCIQERLLALEAKRQVSEWVDGRWVILKGLGRDKYFRIDAAVVVDGLDVGAALAKAGLARPYSGATKPDWCE